MDILGNTNPWSDLGCGRPQCHPCETNPEGRGTRDCWSENCTYQISCKACEEIGKTAKYIGESARTLYLRSLEHYKGLKDRKVDNV